MILIIDIAFSNHPREKFSLPDPYYSPKEIINHFYGPPEKRIDMGSFSGASYHLAVLVDILVRKKQTNLLNELWKSVSHILLSELSNNELWETFRWHCDSGEQVENFYNKPQSWKALQADACQIDYQRLPKYLVKHPFSYYFLLCYPHRLNRSTAKLIDLLDNGSLLLPTK